ncbi:ATP-binding protein [Actinoplanes palleronii]|uniref:Transcriptional regulator n=1 Tax=Actinoplanes palleronii TaxID=113570 RepID=A0ABQ4BIB1_9ACTN|nr:LuxR family transcriptional regulator [Actinoplanes palleronii]GIE70365.1 transcriptional regulator [Actinoplanes palleronii]
MLVGRAETLDRVGSLCRGPDAGALITGLPGAGKTAVITAVRKNALARGDLVLTATGARSDRHLPFGLLAGLLAGSPRLLASLAPAGGASPHPLRLRLDVLGWLEAATAERPVLIIIDDAQWCDETSLSVLGFVAGRLRGGGLALLAACRDDEIPEALADLPPVRLAPLSDPDAIRLLHEAGVPVSGADLSRVLSRAAGNPLALLELGHAAATNSALPELGHAAAPDSAVPTSVELAFAARLRLLPEPTRQALLLVAAGDGDLRTAGRVTEPGALLLALAPAEAAGLVSIAGHRVQFRHPLARSAAYTLGAGADRARVHRQLAAAHDDDPDRRVWHLAEATVVADEDVATALEEAADRAYRRGAYAEAVRSLIKAADLSPSPADREKRTLGASWMAASGGFFEWITRLAGPLRTGSADRSTRAVASHALAYAMSQTARQRDAWAALLDALELLLDEDPNWGWTTLTTLAALAYRRGSDTELVRHWFDRYDRVPQTPDSAFQEINAASRAWISVQLDPLTRSAEVLELVRTAPVLDGAPAGVAAQEMMLGAAAWLYDEPRTALMRLGRAVELYRTGAPANMANSLMTLAHLQLDVGDLDAADQSGRLLVDLAAAERHAFAGEHGLELRARVAAVRGQVEAGRAMCGAGLPALETGEFLVLEIISQVTRSYLAFAERDAQGAWAAVRSLFDADGEPLHPHASYRELAHYVATGVRAGLVDELRPVVERAGRRLIGSGPRQQLQLARARAQLAGDDAEPFHRAATAGPDAAQWPFELAGAHLEYGAWLRRQQRAKDARAELQTALTGFERLGARPWADLAIAELRAAGVVAAGPAPSAWASLTGQEREVVRLAAAGLTNREIGGMLFLSARTVSTHLYKAYPKLGVTSRTQLRDLVPAER